MSRIEKEPLSGPLAFRASTEARPLVESGRFHHRPQDTVGEKLCPLAECSIPHTKLLYKVQRALARTRSLHKTPPQFTSALPQPLCKHSPVEAFQQPLSDRKIWSSNRTRQANKD